MREKALVALLVGCVALACGPSLTAIHEGTVRFEHCYRVDLEPNAASAQRKACWQRWVSSYTVGQPRDRIEYAERRLNDLAGDDKKRPTLAVDGERRPEERQFYLVVPGPTSARHPPPPIATVVSASDAGPPFDAPAAGGAPVK